MINRGVIQVFEHAVPRLRRCENGGWMAVSPEESPVRIGVVAWSADEARNRYLRSRREWIVLLEEALHDLETVAARAPHETTREE